MKKFLMIFALLIGLVSCGNNSDSAAKDNTSEKDRVEVIYFHGKQRCASCMAIEKNTREVIDSIFADKIADGSLVFRIVDISTPEGEQIADKYEVTWSSLFVNKWKNGEETRDNLTEFGFGNARKNTEVFKNGLADKIRQSLE